MVEANASVAASRARWAFWIRSSASEDPLVAASTGPSSVADFVAIGITSVVTIAVVGWLAENFTVSTEVVFDARGWGRFAALGSLFCAGARAHKAGGRICTSTSVAGIVCAGHFAANDLAVVTMIAKWTVTGVGDTGDFCACAEIAWIDKAWIRLRLALISLEPRSAAAFGCASAFHTSSSVLAVIRCSGKGDVGACAPILDVSTDDVIRLVQLNDEAVLSQTRRCVTNPLDEARDVLRCSHETIHSHGASIHSIGDSDSAADFKVGNN